MPFQTRRDRRRPPRWPPTDCESGNSTNSARCGVAAVAWGKAVRREQLLEPRLRGRLDLHDVARPGLHVGPLRTRQQRPDRSTAGGVADGADPCARTVGNQPEHHGVRRIDVRAERTGQADLGRRDSGQSVMTGSSYFVRSAAPRSICFLCFSLKRVSRLRYSKK